MTVAYKDIQTIPLNRRYAIRYIWLKDAKHAQAIALTLGYISRQSTIPDPESYTIINKELLRLDAYEEPLDYLDTWEKLEFDPTFSLLLTKGTLKFLTTQGIGGEAAHTIQVNSYEWTYVDKDKEFIQNGKKVAGRWIKKNNPKKLEDTAIEDVIRVNPDHINPMDFLLLQDECRTSAPIVTYDYFITRALTSIQDKGIYKKVFGGLYYDFIGIRFQKDGKGSQEDALYESLGVGDGSTGSAAKIFERIRSDRRAAIFRSNVTGHPRMIEWFPSLVGRDTIGLVFVTHDLKSQDIDIDQHPIYNLLKFNDAAREVIFTKPNGLIGGALYNFKGELQDEVPPDIANDSTIPDPHNKRLESIMSCLACHNVPNDSLGYKPFTNDVAKIKLDIVDTDTDRLRGLYKGNSTQVLMRARDDLAKATLEATGPLKDGGDQTKITSLATEQMVKIQRKYKYDLITPEIALTEMAFDPNKTKLKDVILPIPAGELIPEDPRIGALLSGVEINRADWALLYSFAMSRVKR